MESLIKIVNKGVAKQIRIKNEKKINSKRY